MIDLFKKFGITRVFDGGGGAGDANNSDASGGNDDNKAGGGGGDNKPAGDKTPKDQTYELKVGGETRQVTLDEMKDLAQKSDGANQKFQDASDLKKQAEDGMRIQALVKRISDTDGTPAEADIKEFAAMIGVDPSEFVEYLKDDDTPQGDNKGKLDSEALAEALGMPGADAKAILALSRQNLIDTERGKIRKNSDISVDKDEFFGKIKVGKGGDGIIDTVKDMVAEDVFAKIEHGETYGAELVAASIQKMRAHLIKMGIPGKPDEHPITLGLVPGVVLPSEVSSETPIERISSADKGAEDNFVKRAMQKGLKLMRDKASKQN